ncbi:MAG: glycosyltransferase [Flavobacteriaceae bacterium]|nr:glycosyltransferase [Flavobacteriaceae bacterium]
MNIETILFTYNRPDHTKKVLEGLRSEGFNKFKVYIDGAKNAKDLAERQVILAMLQDIDWAAVSIVNREESFGLAKSIVTGVTEALTRSEAVIVLEDDCVPLPGFKVYMETTLAYYAGNSKVTSICGYRYPSLNIDQLESAVFTLERFCPWGWATWKESWDLFIPSLTDLVYKVQKTGKDIDRLGQDMKRYCSDPRFLNMQMDIWSLNWILSQYLYNSKIIYPKNSLINNIGFDGSGVHSEVTTDFESEVSNMGLDRDFLIRSLSDNIEVDENLQSEVVSFLESTSKMTMMIKKGVGSI